MISTPSSRPQLRPELAVSTSRPRPHHLGTEQGRHEIDLIAEWAVPIAALWG